MAQTPEAAIAADIYAALREKFAAPGRSQVTETSYLTLDLHWADTVRFLAEVTGTAVTPEELTVVCVTKNRAEHGMVEGKGARVLHVLNEQNVHFDPLFPVQEPQASGAASSQA